MARRLGTATLGLASEAGFPPIFGVDPTVLSYPAFGADQALALRPLGGADAPIRSWALGLDLYIAQPAAPFVSLLQTGDGDGDLFLRDNGDGTARVGVAGVYDGALPFDQWSRLIVTITQEGGRTMLRKYLNGVQAGAAQDLGVTRRFDIDPAVGLRLLTDNDGETAPGALSGVFFSPVVPSPAEVAGLVATIAAPNAAGFFPASIVTGAIELDFAGEDVTPRYGAAEVILDGFGFRTPVTLNDSAFGLASQFGVDGPVGDDTPVLAYADYAPNEGVLVRLPGVVGSLSSYTAVWDVNVTALAGFQALLQTDVSQGGDGEFFIRGDGGLGIGGNYDGAVAPGAWSRIAITVQDRGDGSATLSKYLDGVFLDSQTVDAARFTLNAASGFLLMTDDDGETGAGYLAHFGLSTQPLDAAAIAALGGADADGPFTAITGDAAPLPATGAAERVLTLRFDSGFRPYDGMTGEVLVSIDGEAFRSLLTLTTANSGGDSALGRVNEAVALDFTVDEGAQSVAFAFNLRDAGNDWWWAVDNIALTDQGGAVIYAESFDGLAADLRPSVDENIGFPGWTDTPPAGWSRETDPAMPQGTTEWQGWSFATPAFWTAADGQNRADFTRGRGVMAIADPDEWDDFNDGSQNGADFDATITTPTIALQIPGAPVTLQLGFEGYAPNVEFGFDAVEVIDNPAAAPTQNTIADLLLRDDGAPVLIDLAAAFGEGATDFVVTAADGAVVAAGIDGATLRLNALALGHSDIVVTATVGDATVTENFRAIVAGANAYVFAVIPDTQDYTSDQTLADNSFFRMTEWMLAQQQSLGIVHAIHVGDIVQFGAASQWDIAKDAMERLDGKLTYTLGVGNHDQQRPGFSSAFSFETDIDAYFTPEQVGATAAQSGGVYDGFDVGPDLFGNGGAYADSIRNHYTTLTTPDGQDWLILSLEFGMPDDVLRWAGEVIEDHLDHRVIIDTHSWNGGDGRVTPTTQDLNTDNGGWGYAIRENPRNVNDGEDAWRELASKYANVTFTFNGHNFMGGAETVVSYGAGGDPVHQIFVNYQNGAWRGPEGVGSNGGNGAIRLIVVDPDNNRFTTHTKLVELDTYFEEFPDHQEVFEGANFATPTQIAVAGAGPTRIVQGDDVSALVTLDGAATRGDVAGARFAWFAADGQVLGETDGAPLQVALPTGTNRLSLRLTDANGNVSTDETAVIVAAPGALLIDTFDDGDAAGWGAPAAAPQALFTLGTDLGLSLPALGGEAGAAAGVLSVPALAGDAGIRVTPTGATGVIDSYTLIFDILLAPTSQGFTALYQTDVANAGDAEIFFRNDGATASFGISGDYDGALAYGQWGRVALAFEVDASGRQTLNKYLDGVFLDAQVVDADVSDGSRWSIDAAEGFLLLSDNDGETSDAFLGALHFTPGALDAAAITALGAADADGPVAAAADPAAFQLSFDGALDALDYGAATVAPVSLAAPSATSYLVKGSIFGNPDGVGEAALYQQSNRSDERLLWLDGADWRDYVFDVAIEPADNDTVGAFFYYKDERNHYLLTMDQQNDRRTLIRVQDGVETVLATETDSYRHFAMQDLRIAVMAGRITITLDDVALFGGPVTDAAPLDGGTVGFLTRSMDRVLFDDVSVNPITLAARALTTAPEGRWAVDLDGDGRALFDLTAQASLSAAGVARHDWLVDGVVRATGEAVTLALAPGETTVTLRVTDVNGLTAEDSIALIAASQRAILAQDDFADGDFAGWTVVDEGAIDGPSDWAVQDGALVQRSNIGSTQQGTGSAAYSVGGDGPFLLRDGTYALRDDPAARAWTDYAVEATLTPGDDDGVGVMFRYSGAGNYYKLEADAQTDLVMLTRHLDGRETILARSYDSYTPGEDQHWRIEVEGGEIRAWIDGKAVFGTPVEDRPLASGTVGLYAWSSENLRFDDIVVTLLDEPVNVVAGTAASEFLQGTDGMDLIIAGGGKVDRIRAGAGLDSFDFTAMRADAGRNTVRVSDIEVGETIIGIDPDSDIASAARRGGSLYLTLADDGDQLILTGVTAADQLLWQPSDTLF